MRGMVSAGTARVIMSPYRTPSGTARDPLWGVVRSASTGLPGGWRWAQPSTAAAATLALTAASAWNTAATSKTRRPTASTNLTSLFSLISVLVPGWLLGHVPLRSVPDRC